MKLYKLTNNKSETYNNTKWAVGVKHRIFKRGHELCSDQVFHVYRHPVQAVFFNPIHANIDNPRLFEVRTGKIVADDGTKVGVKTIEVIREMVLPKLSREQHITITIKCAKLVVDDKVWNLWADNWLSGKDRSEAAAWATAEATRAAWVAARAAAWAARAAAGAARAAAWEAAEAAEATAWATAEAAREAAGAAAEAAAEAAGAWEAEATAWAAARSTARAAAWAAGWAMDKDEILKIIVKEAEQ